ncbi:MAG TPA: hypothetical protein VHI13_04980 [Candidatus Kapabacteria bacterium]|nr:hypothetical protein [Candidatus Kapabacteria bacterium]
MPTARPYTALAALAVATALLFPPCTAAPDSVPPAPDAFSIAVFGDMPYITGYKAPAPILRSYRNVLDDINAHPAAFIVHAGDITNGPYRGDSVTVAHCNELESMAHPLIYIFADSERTNCRRRGFDPPERLARLREVFTGGDQSLGSCKLTLERQSNNPTYALYRESVRWIMGNVLFPGLNVPGSNNNRGPDSLHPSPEYVARNPANLAWLREWFAMAARKQMRGIAIFVQADPGFDRESMPPQSRRYFTGFNDLLATLRELSIAFARPALFVQGDSHYFMMGKPLLADSATRRRLPNFTRAEGFGDRNYHWLRITADSADPNLFRFDPMLVPKNLTQ